MGFHCSRQVQGRGFLAFQESLPGLEPGKFAGRRTRQGSRFDQVNDDIDTKMLMHQFGYLVRQPVTLSRVSFPRFNDQDSEFFIAEAGD